MTLEEQDQKQKIKLLKQQFWKDVAELFRIGNPRGTGLLNFIRKRIQQARVNKWEEQEVLTEACVRSIEYIEKNCKEIQHPASFLRQVSLNIIREEVRKNVNNDKIIRNIYIGESYEEDISSEEEFSHALEKLNLSFKKLSFKYRQLLELRFIRGFSYKEIQEYLLDRGEDVPNLDALRKQMSRALKRLRREYDGSSCDKSSC